MLVRTAVGQLETAKEHWISKFPAIAYFRNGEYLKYKGEPSNSGSVLKWLTSTKATALSNQIEGTPHFTILRAIPVVEIWINTIPEQREVGLMYLTVTS